MGICLGITSGKGGTGKSTVAAGLAAAFEKSGFKTVIADMDLGMRCQDLLFGLENEIVYDISDIEEAEDLSRALYKAPGFENLFIIPSSLEAKEFEFNKLEKLSKQLKNEFDAVIFDFPAGTDLSLYGALGNDALFLTVCNPDAVSVRDARLTADRLPKTDNEPRIIINKFDKKSFLKTGFKNIDEIIDESGLRLIGIVPYDPLLSLLSVRHKINLRKKSGKAFLRISGRLCGKAYSLPRSI